MKKNLFVRLDRWDTEGLVYAFSGSQRKKPLWRSAAAFNLHTKDEVVSFINRLYKEYNTIWMISPRV